MAEAVRTAKGGELQRHTWRQMTGPRPRFPFNAGSARPPCAQPCLLPVLKCTILDTSTRMHNSHTRKNNNPSNHSINNSRINNSNSNSNSREILQTHQFIVL